MEISFTRVSQAGEGAQHVLDFIRLSKAVCTRTQRGQLDVHDHPVENADDSKSPIESAPGGKHVSGLAILGKQSHRRESNGRRNSSPVVGRNAGESSLTTSYWPSDTTKNTAYIPLQ